jgi:CRP/FNR family transcriptional regulator, cyclic AMP receptor protein
MIDVLQLVAWVLISSFKLRAGRAIAHELCCCTRQGVLKWMRFRSRVMVPIEPLKSAPRVAAPGRSAPSSAPRSVLLVESEKLVGGPAPLFQALNDREKKEVLTHGIRRVVHRRQMLFSQGTPHDGIYLIETGRVRVFYVAPSGREITLAYWNPGNFVGAPEVFGSGVHLWSGVATADCSIVHFLGKVLRRLVLRIPSLAIGIIEGLAFKGKCYSTLAQMLGTRSVTERLAHLLLHLADTYGMPQQGGIVILAALTHADIAHMVGATRQWVTISLKHFEEQGIIASSKSKLVIYRLDKLGELSGRAA